MLVFVVNSELKAKFTKELDLTLIENNVWYDKYYHLGVYFSDNGVSGYTVKGFLDEVLADVLIPF